MSQWTNCITEIGTCIKAPTKSTFTYKDNETEVLNFTLVGLDKESNKHIYINCQAFGSKINICQNIKTGDQVEVFGYYKEKVSGSGKTYKNFCVESMDILVN